MIEKEQETQIEQALKIKSLSREVSELESKVAKLMGIIKDNGLDDELEALDSTVLSDEEFICINELKKLRTTSEIRELTSEETKIFDTLYKALKSIRTGQPEDVSGKKRRKKPLNTAELFKLVQNE